MNQVKTGPRPETDQEPAYTREQLFSQELRVVRGMSVEDQEKGFCPLNLRSLIPEERLTFSLFLKTVAEDTKEVQFLPCCTAGEVFPRAWLARLREMGIDRLYFRQEELDQVISYLNNYLLVLDIEGPATSLKKMEVFYDHLKLTIQRAFTAPKLGPHIRLALGQVNQIIQELENPAFPLNSIWEILIGDYSLYNRAVNVFLISVALMIFLGKKPAESRKMGIAALFHDVGMTRIPQEILYKTATLTPEEQSWVHKHPQIGFDMLKKYPAIPLESIRLVLEHHENADGSGYPQGLRLNQQHPHTRILRLVDAYDALTCRRSYRLAYRAFRALEIMRTQKGPRGPIFDQRLIDNLIKFLVL